MPGLRDVGHDPREGCVVAAQGERPPGVPRADQATLDDPVRAEFSRAVKQAASHPESRQAQSRRDATIAQPGTSYLPVKLEPARTYRLTQVSAPVFDQAGAVAMVVLVVAVGLELATEEIAARGDRVRETAARLTAAIGGVVRDGRDRGALRTAIRP
jgi:DNA-binding IclR family transcriptional regulator